MASNKEKLFLAVNRDSQLGKVLERLAHNPALRVEEVGRLLTQRGRSGAQVPVNPTRASFLVDVLADALGGERRRGMGIIDVSDALTTEQKGRGISVVEQKTVVVGHGVAPKVQAVEVRADVHATLTPQKDEEASGVKLIFPDAPSLKTPMAEYVEPDWYETMKSYLDNDDARYSKHVALAGPPGIGKSTGPEQYFIRKGQPFVTVNGDQGLRRRDLVGTPEITGGTSRFLCAEYVAAMIFGWGCIINEVNAADPDALLFINGQIEVPHTINVHGRSFPVHKDARLVVTYNPSLIGTKPLPQSFKDRFGPIIVPFPDKDFLHKLLVAKGMPPHAQYADRLIKFAIACNQKHERGQLRYQISPRRLFDAVFQIEKCGLPSPLSAIKKAVFQAVDSKPDRDVLQATMNEVYGVNNG